MLKRVNVVYRNPRAALLSVEIVLSKGGGIRNSCGLYGGERSSREHSMATSALGRGAGFLRGDDLLGDG